MVDASGVLSGDEQLCAEAAGIDDQRMAELGRYAREQGQPLLEALLQHGGISEQKVYTRLSEAMRLPVVLEPPGEIPPDVLAAMSAALVFRYRVAPLGLEDGTLRVACADPFDWQRWDELEQILRRPLQKVLCPPSVIARILKANYGLGAETVERLVADRRTPSSADVPSDAVTDLSAQEAANEPTVVNFVNKVLTDGIAAGASDIHFEPFETRYAVRYRIDGVLEDVSVPAAVKLLKPAVVSRIKIMCGLDITEKRLPQDGRTQVVLAGQRFDLRVSVLPGVFGESITIRLQNRQMIEHDFAALGFSDDDRRAIETVIEVPHGLLLVTGPTGSGKTTTLYTCLSPINRPDIKVITVEDPGEYWIDGVLQMQVHEEIGFGFAAALRGMLRHDPDVMLVGEIRDRPTADIAIRSSLTGHLVFSTLHTNDAASAVVRLHDLGVEPYLLATSLSGVIAQRLVRKLCPRCRRKVWGPVAELKGREAWEAVGCEACRFTGYAGRTAVAEILTVTPEIREMIRQRAPAERIKESARQGGMGTLRQRTLDLVAAGVTSLAEVVRMAQDEQ